MEGSGPKEVMGSKIIKILLCVCTKAAKVIKWSIVLNIR